VEVEALLAANAARRLDPVEVGLPPVPRSCSPDLARVAEFFALVYGLRLAASDGRPVPFAAGWIAEKLGLETKQTAYRLRCQLVTAGVLVKVGAMHGRNGRRGTDLFLPGELPADQGADS